MKIAILIIFYIVGVIATGVYFYKKIKAENIIHIVDDADLGIIVLLSIFFPIIYLIGLLMIIIKKIGDKLCKNQ